MNRALTCAIHQPNFFPRVSTVAKLLAVDTWIVLDDVQFATRDYQHRVRLSFEAERELRTRWFTLQVTRPLGRSSLINQVRIVEPDSDAGRFEAILQSYYGKSEFYADGVGKLAEAGVLHFSENIVDLDVATTRFVLDLLGWRGDVVWASEFEVSQTRNQRLIDLTKAVGATNYVSGSGGLRYINQTLFTSANIELSGPTRYLSNAGRSSLDVLLREGLEGLTAVSSAWRAALGPQ